MACGCGAWVGSQLAGVRPDYDIDMTPPRPFRSAISDSAITDLHERIDRARWPDQIEGSGWSHGTELHYLRDLVQYWRHDYDWRAGEATINQFDQFLFEIDGLDIHFIHQRSSHANAMPLLMTHGWPGSIVEFLEVIPRLTQPERFGGDASDDDCLDAPSAKLKVQISTVEGSPLAFGDP